MKNIEKNLISSVCALALVVNSVAGVMAQDRKKDAPVLIAATIVDNDCHYRSPLGWRRASRPRSVRQRLAERRQRLPVLLAGEEFR